MEAIASSRIEGTQASLSELFYFEAATESPKPSVDVLEVNNYRKALDYGINRLNELPLSLRLIREIHEILMTGVRGGTPDKTPGRFRTSQNWIGGYGFNLDAATFVPPPPDRLMEVLGDWEIFLNQRNTELPLLIQCAMMHYQFETIHPFLDGNGRVGRLLISLFLHERKALPYPLLYLSSYFERHQDEYYDRLLAVSQKGQWEQWIAFFLKGVVTQGERAIESARKLVDRREQYRNTLYEMKATAPAIRLLDMIFTLYIVSNRTVVERLKVSFPTAQKAIEQLIKIGALEPFTGKQRNRFYIASQLLQSLEETMSMSDPTDDTE